jgi:hypothetical protein
MKPMSWNEFARAGMMTWLNKILDEPFGLEVLFNNWGTSEIPMEEITIGYKGSPWQMTWKEFQDNGLLWWVNVHLHLLGCAICFDYSEDEAKGKRVLDNVFPARVKYRGFSEIHNSIGYVELTKYLRNRSQETGVPFSSTMLFAMENMDDLLKEANS